MEETWARRGYEVLVIRMFGSKEEGARGDSGDLSEACRESLKAKESALFWKAVENFERASETPSYMIN